MAGDSATHSTDILSPEEQAACEPWSLPVVDGSESTQGEQPWARALTASQLEEIHRQAYAQGRAEGSEAGYREGAQRAAEELQPLVDRCRALLDVMAAPLDELDAEVEQALVDLAFAIARQLVHREIKLEPGEVIAAVREAVAVLPSAARDVRVFLHPIDVPLVRDALAIEGQSTGWRLLEDPRLTRGGCRVESGSSRIDATVEGRLAAVIAHVLGGRRAQDDG